ncbi:MAG TPA: MnhB domain-containing protein [Candidatus Dormibacteraeota bacterium]|nr:MnhB domain-containing protein [Candidatus Dormibacteraeota bacterium]
MSLRARTGLFLVSGPVLLVVLLVGFGGLPDFGHYIGPYGKVLNLIAVPQRHATDVVTAVNFDYRAFDTMGEEFILFAAVLGLAVILRSMRDERERPSHTASDEHQFGEPSSLLRVFGTALVGVTLVLGMYIVTHGTLTPGGGFQGGLILAAALLVVFLVGEYLAMQFVAPHVMVEFGEAAGAAGYVLVGLGGLIFASIFFKNFIGLGSAGHIISAGTMPISNIAVGIEVAGAFVLLWTEFLDQALVIRGGE